MYDWPEWVMAAGVPGLTHQRRKLPGISNSHSQTVPPSQVQTDGDGDEEGQTQRCEQEAEKMVIHAS